MFNLRSLLTYFLLLILTSFICQAQEFKLIKLSTSKYPEIKGIFLSTTPGGERITDARPEDFTVTENNAACKVTEVTNPALITIPASIVLVFDISYSMSGDRLSLAKKTARDFIEQVPLETSEVAIASFSDQVYVNCDFTQDRDRLLKSIAGMHSSGGTNYTKAFLDENSGVLAIAKNGRNRKCIIFLTDGLSNTDANEVVAKAKQDHTTVFCITMELPIPDVLKDIASFTGGKYFQSKAEPKQLETIYSSIFQTLELSKFGTVTWIAASDCQKSRNIHLTFRNIPVDLAYDVPLSKVGSLEIDPLLLSFGAAPAGVTKNLSVDIIARNIPLTLTNLSIPGKVPFLIMDSLHFPIELQPNRIQSVTLGYKPGDAGLLTGKLLVSSKECPDKSITLMGGNEEQLRIICPKGGEVLVVGTDTSIQWEGVKKNTPLSISYRTAPDKEWKPIGAGKDLIYAWTVPNDTGSCVQIKLKPIPVEGNELFLTSTMPNQKSGIRSAFFSNDGSMVVTTDKFGIVKTWDASSGRTISNFDGFHTMNAIFGRTTEQIVFLSKDEFFTWDTQASKLTNRLSLSNKLIFTSYLLPDGTEKLIPCNVSRDKANAIKLWQPVYNNNAFLFEKDMIKAAGMTPDGTKALIIDAQNTLKIWNSGSGQMVKCNSQPINPISIVINPNGKTALVFGPGMLTMLDMEHGNELFHSQRSTYNRFSNSGDMVIVRTVEAGLTFMDSYTGKWLFSLGNTNFFKCMSTGYNVLYYRNDSLILFDASQQKKIFRIYRPSLHDAVLSPDNHKLLVIHQSNNVELYNAENGGKIGRLDAVDNNIRSAAFSPDGKAIVLVMDDYSMQYWSTMGKNQIKEVVSGYFSIISPKPLVKKMIRFNDQFINEPKELISADFITNPTTFPILIRKIQIWDKDTGDFELVSNPYPALLPSFGMKAGEFRFTPKTEGQRETKIVTYTATDTFFTVVTGMGVTKPFRLSADRIDFGKVKVFQHSDTTICLLRNESKVPISITEIVNEGPDKEQFTLLSKVKSFLLQPDSCLKAQIRFAPVNRGKTSGSLAIRMHGIIDPQLVYLSGEGVAARDLWLRGRTLNSSDSLPMVATVVCIDLASNTTAQKVVTDSTGRFAFRVNADRNYGLMADKSGYLSTSENIDVREATLSDTIQRDIYLTELKNGASIRMNCVFFESSKSNLLNVSINELNRMKDMLSHYPGMHIEIQGHTDSFGNDANNMILSRSRANAVRNYFLKHGIGGDRLSVKAFGETRPVSTNSTEEGRRLNRRVELKIVGMGKN